MLTPQLGRMIAIMQLLRVLKILAMALIVAKGCGLWNLLLQYSDFYPSKDLTDVELSCMLNFV